MIMRGATFPMVSVPFLLMIISSLILVLFLSAPQSAQAARTLVFKGANTANSYVVVFDAGSSGSRVHVFCFDSNLDLVPIDGNELELYAKIEPGLSAYESDPNQAAESLRPLLEQAENIIPKELRSETPVRVGATAGLRLLKGDAADRILQAVGDFLEHDSSLKSKPEWVSILKGSQEGSFMWLTINYALENLGKKYADTVGVIDLGGGSVQMSYAISAETAAKAPKSDVNDTYVKELTLKGSKYHLYVHSYLNFGVHAARVEILKAVGGSGNPCMLTGYQGSYTYGGVVYNASTTSKGANVNKCMKATFKALRVKAPCPHEKCTFGGIWNGGGGDGQKDLYLSSSFYYGATQLVLGDSTLSSAKIRPVDFKIAAKRACKTKWGDAKSAYPLSRSADLPFICMDLVYEYMLLVQGFGLEQLQEVTVVDKVNYRNSMLDAAWPLGSAIELISSTTLSTKIFAE